MKFLKIKQRIEKLKKLIEKYRYSRHVLNNELISIDIEDSLKKELFDLEQKYPQFITLDSPTQRVGGKPLEKFIKIKHFEPMLSLNDAFTEKDIIDWLERISKILTFDERKKIDFFCELKIDGLAIELIYKNGILETGSTRGDGLIGEDVSQNLKTIESIPLKLKLKEEQISQFSQLIVRGEAVIAKKNFEIINKEQLKKGLTPFANPRNLAAGSIRQLDSKIIAKRKLDFIVYDLIINLNEFSTKIWQKIKTHEEKHKILESLGFKTNNKYSKYCQNLKEVFGFYQDVQKIRENLSYEIDGIVVVVNDNEIFKKLGVIGKAPRGAIAFKFPLKQTTTIVEDVKFQIGRTGTLTPVAILKSVQVGGALISRATLHNEDEIKKLDVRIGDTVAIGRAGDVIPDIIKVLPELRTGKEVKIFFPKNCPSCNEKLIKIEKESAWRCLNLKCLARKKEYFYHFVSKDAFNIIGLGPKIINKLLDQGLIFDPIDLFQLKENDILTLNQFAEKSAKNLIEAIQSRKTITLSKLIYALGIRNVGEETAQNLVKYFGNLEKLKEVNLENLQAINDIGPIVAKSIYDFFQNNKNLEFLEKLKKVGIKIINENKEIKNKILIGKNFVITGSLETMKREEIKEKIKELGGKISQSVSKKINYLIVGKDPGSKVKKAKELEVKILNENEFLKLIKN